jgi:hypothetical protein
MINPAAAGVYDFVDLTLSGRWQWLGVQDAPRTSYFAFSVPVRFKPKFYNPGIRTSSGIVENPDIKTGKLKHTFGGQLWPINMEHSEKCLFLGPMRFIFR